VRVCSVGHGARPLAEFLALLEAGGVRVLVDVRSYPGSRLHPHFGRDALAAALGAVGIGYEHLRGLGGRRRGREGSPHAALRVPGFRAYADHMDSAEFARDYARLRDIAAAAPTAFMCAETLWWRCHRRFIADRLTADGWEVVHLLSPGDIRPHVLPSMVRVARGRLVYDVTGR
jgi:uncharacterized protein (DUF488 family)